MKVTTQTRHGRLIVWHWIASLGLVVGSCAGCGGGGGGGGSTDRTPPVIMNVAITPNTLGTTGGLIAIGAKVIDNTGVARVWAEVQKPDGSKANVDLVGDAQGDYQSQWSAPANSTGNAVVYRFTIKACDAADNNVSSSSTLVTVSGVGGGD